MKNYDDKGFDWSKASDYDLSHKIWHGVITDDDILRVLKREGLSKELLVEFEYFMKLDKLSDNDIDEVMEMLEQVPAVLKFHYLRHFYLTDMRELIDSRQDWLRDIAELREMHELARKMETNDE